MGNVIFYDSMKGEWGGNDPFLNGHKSNWFSTEEYIELQIYFSGYGDESGSYLQRHQFSEARRWMEKNLEGEVIIKYKDRSCSGFITINAYFENESDAVAFKLTWLHEQKDEQVCIC